MQLTVVYGMCRPTKTVWTNCINSFKNIARGFIRFSSSYSCHKKCTIYIYIFFIKFFSSWWNKSPVKISCLCLFCYQCISVSLLLPFTLSIHNIEISVIFYIYFSDIEDEIVSLKEFSTELIVSSAVQCIKTILKQDVDLPNTLPGGMSARFRMGTGLANYIQVIRFCLEL